MMSQFSHSTHDAPDSLFQLNGFLSFAKQCSESGQDLKNEIKNGIQSGYMLSKFIRAVAS